MLLLRADGSVALLFTFDDCLPVTDDGSVVFVFSGSSLNLKPFTKKL